MSGFDWLVLAIAALATFYAWRTDRAYLRKVLECETSHLLEVQARGAFNSLLGDNIAMSKQLVKLTAILAERAGIDLAEEPKPGLDESHPLSVGEADREAARARRQAELRDQGFTPAKVDDASVKPRPDQVEDPEAIKMYDTPYHEHDEVDDPWREPVEP